MDIRKNVVNVLSTKIGEKLATSYEKEIYKMCIASSDTASIGSSALFKNEYEKLGMLMEAKDRKERTIILNDIKNKNIGWDSSCFNDVRNSMNSIVNRVSKPMEVAEGIFTCHKCGGKKTTSIGIQLRSADEPMTNFVTCVTCKNKWKC